MNENTDAFSEISLCRPVSLAQRLVWVDGPTRSGKTTMCRLLGSLEDCELERIEEVIDYIGFMYSFGKMSHDAAVTMLRVFPDVHLYNALLSRNLNFRWRDTSSIWRAARPMTYLKRLFGGEHQDALKAQGAEKAIFQNHTHFQMERIGIHFDAHPETLKVIELQRHPIDLVHAWWSKKRGGDLCRSPWNVAICGGRGDDCVHHLAFGWEETYLAMAPLARIVRMLHGAQMRARDTYKSLPAERREKVMLVDFDVLTTAPQETAERAADFLNTRTTRATARTLRKMGLPYTDHATRRADNLAALQDELDDPSRRMLDEMIADFETGWKGAPA